MSSEEDKINNIPQLIEEWKKDLETQLKNTSIMVDNKRYVRYENAKNCMRQCFTKGFKTARRNRTALGRYLISEIEKRFIVNPKEPKQ